MGNLEYMDENSPAYGCYQLECSVDEVPLTVNVSTDFYPEETSWELVDDCTGKEVDSVAPGSLDGGGASFVGNYTNNYCVTPARYSFTIKDSSGDGMCCQYGSGSYSVTYDSVVVAEGGEFQSSETTTFGSPCPVSDDGGSGG